MTTTTPKTKARKMPDSVVAEVRRAKVKLLERYHYNLDEMARDAQARQSHSGHEAVDRSTAG